MSPGGAAAPSSRSLRLAVGLLSGAALAHQLLLMRLFSIVQWHHFAYMVISLALLGYGASGTFLAFLAGAGTGARPSNEGGGPAERRFRAVFATAATLFGLTAVASFAAAQHVPFNPLEAAWNTAQLGSLAVLYLLLAAPFFCAATAIGLALHRFAGEADRIYRADLVGAGCGAAAIIGLLFLLRPVPALELLGATGPAAAALSLFSGGRRARLVAGVLALLAVLSPLAWPAAWLELEISQFKGLAGALRVPGAEVVAERSSPLGLLTVVRSPEIPFRHAPGLSLTHAEPLPHQLAIFTDAESMTVINRSDGDFLRLGYLRELPTALPYRLLPTPATAPGPEVLVLGAGGGTEVASALAHGARRVVAVEYDPLMVELVREKFADFSGGLYAEPRVDLEVAEARSFLAASDDSYGLIQLAMVDSLAASAAGVRSLSESYLYTVEAFDVLLERLDPGGVVAITRWLRVPPRESLKLLLTAAVALERRGLDPGPRLALIRTWNTVTLLVRREPLGPEEVAAVREFTDERSWDIAWLPGMGPGEANRYNVLDAPYFHEGAAALLGAERAEYLERYKFDLRPATDDRPYFFHFLEWRTLPEIWSLRGRGGTPMLEWGYVVLVATLAQALIAGLALIVLPLLLRPAPRRPGHARWRSAVYFLALGLAFLLLEIATIQRLVLFLGHPLYAVAVVLAAFLVFAGIGSGWSSRLLARTGRDSAGVRRAVRLATGAAAALAVLYLAALPPVLRALVGWPDPPKVLLSLALLAPLALLMGMPFPLGLERLRRVEPGWVPWAWGLNGWASVLSAVLATLLAIHFGFSVVFAIAAGLYLVAGWAVGGMTQE